MGRALSFGGQYKEASQKVPHVRPPAMIEIRPEA